MNRLKWIWILCAPLCAQDADRNFAGVWKLNAAASELRAFPGSPPAMMRVEHNGPSISCLAEHSGGKVTVCSYATDGSETKLQLNGSTISSKTKWEGSALLINSIVSGPSNYTAMDRWRLSKDRNTLRIRRQIVRLHGESESTLVYERQGILTSTDNGPESPKPNNEAPATASEYTVAAGTKIPLKLVKALSTKSSGAGDRIYLETVFPVVLDGRIVIPPGSYVAGTLTQVKRPGRVRGRGELFLRFDSLTLSNGVTREFRSRAGAMDGDIAGSLEREEGKVRSEGNKGGDARTAGEAAAAGASVGAIAGGLSGRPGMGVGIGAAGGAAAGLAGVLLSRGPDAVLPKGTILEMVLDRELRFKATELIADR